MYKRNSVRDGRLSHLRMVQLILAHNLDGAFLVGLAVDRFVHVGECTVAHLLNQLVPFQSLRLVEATTMRARRTSYRGIFSVWARSSATIRSASSR